MTGKQAKYEWFDVVKDWNDRQAEQEIFGPDVTLPKPWLDLIDVVDFWNEWNAEEQRSTEILEKLRAWTQAQLKSLAPGEEVGEAAA